MSYTIIERSSRIYNTVAEIFNYTKSSDVVTPIELVRQQVEEVKPTDKVCVPGAGIGTYVLALLEKGVEPKNIFAVEVDPRYFELGLAMFQRFGVNYVHTDFLTWHPKMQFDVIVGNPPYQNPNKTQKAANGRSANGTPLWVKFIEKSSLLLKEGGTLSLIVPSAIATPGGRGMKKASELTLSSISFGTESFFKVKTNISVVSWVKKQSDAPLTVNGIEYPRELPIANVSSYGELQKLQRIWSGSSAWKYMDNRSHHKRENLETILVIRRMYSRDTFAWNLGLDLSRFDKETLIGLENVSAEDAAKWGVFFDSDDGKFLRRVTNYAGNISAAFLQLVNLEAVSKVR